MKVSILGRTGGYRANEKVCEDNLVWNTGEGRCEEMDRRGGNPMAIL